MQSPGHQESEFKFLLEGNVDFAHVARSLGCELGPAVRQENRFFDTEESALGRAHLALRLRSEEGGFSLTAKGPRAGGELPGRGESLSVRPEVEVRLTEAQALAAKNGQIDPVELLRAEVGAHGLLDRLDEARGGAAWSELGSFVNRRWRLTLEREGPLSGLILELDRTELPGGRIDCEIECEVPAERIAAVRPALEALLSELGLSWRPATSKLRRFLEALPSSSTPGP